MSNWPTLSSMLFWSTRRSFTSILRTWARRGFVRALANDLMARTRPLTPADYALTAADRASLRAAAVKDRLGMVYAPKRAAIKRNGGLRGSTATRWSR